jgi:hypothetical protein
VGRISVLALALALSACGSRSDLSAELLQGSAGAPDASAADVSSGGCSAKGQQLADVRFTPTGGFARVQIAALTPAGGNLFIGAWLQDEEDGRYDGEGFIESVLTTGGTLIDVTGGLGQPANLKHYAGGDLAQDGTSLYYARPTLLGTTVSFPDLVARPIAGGPETVIPNPLGAATTTTVTAVAAASPGAVWAVHTQSTPPAWLLRWDGATTTVLGSFEDYGEKVVVVGTTAYVGGFQHIWKAAFDGGGVNDANHTWDSGAALLAANDEAVFFTPEGRSVVRRDVTTGIESRIATGVPFGQNPAAYADATALYVATKQSNLRIPVGGGPWTNLHGDPAYALAGDTCNLYLAEPNPGFPDALVIAIPK